MHASLQMILAELRRCFEVLYGERLVRLVLSSAISAEKG